MSVDKYFNRTYSARDYNCAHLVCEVWKDLTGHDIADTLQGFLTAPVTRRAQLSRLRTLRIVAEPCTPCIVFMQRRKCAPHVGIWVRGRVLHILENTGVQFQHLEVATLGFTRVRFIVC